MGYLVGGPAVSASRYPVDGAATAGQTIIPVPGGFQPGFVDVFVGGARLSPGDFTDTSGMQIVLAKPMAAGTQFNVTAWNPTMVVRNTNVPRVTVEQDATAGQTTIVVPGGFLAGMTDVYIGGTLLQRGDYNDSDGQNIVLAKALSLGTSIKVYGWNPGLVAQPVGGQLAAWRNKLINGNFDFWQRYTSGTAVGFGGDRWVRDMAGAYSVDSMSRQSFAPGQTVVPGNPRYWLQFQHTLTSSGSSDVSLYSQKIEDVRTLAGQNVTLSFYAYAAAATTIKVSVGQYFGTGGSPSPNVYLPARDVALTTGFQKYVLNFSVPSIAGKTIGTNEDGFLQAIFWTNANAGAAASYNLGGAFATGVAINLARVQLEPGNVATQFEDRPIGTELALCQRFFWSSYQPGQVPGQASASYPIMGRQPNIPSNTDNYLLIARVPYPVTMRAVPTCTVYSSNTGASGKAYTSGGSDVPASVSAGGIHACNVQVANTVVGAGSDVSCHVTASAEL